MSSSKAIDSYVGKNGAKRLNCAQAVIHAFGEECGVSPDALSEFASHGGGRAPGGVCGSLYAAEYLLQKTHPERINECREAFLKAGGSTQCREIRGLKKLSCVGCVETAAKLIEKIKADGQ